MVSTQYLRKIIKSLRKRRPKLTSNQWSYSSQTRRPNVKGSWNMSQFVKFTRGRTNHTPSAKKAKSSVGAISRTTSSLWMRLTMRLLIQIPPSRQASLTNPTHISTRLKGSGSPSQKKRLATRKLLWASTRTDTLPSTITIGWQGH